MPGVFSFFANCPPFSRNSWTSSPLRPRYLPKRLSFDFVLFNITSLLVTTMPNVNQVAAKQPKIFMAFIHIIYLFNQGFTSKLTTKGYNFRTDLLFTSILPGLKSALHLNVLCLLSLKSKCSIQLAKKQQQAVSRSYCFASFGVLAFFIPLLSLAS